MQQRGATEMCPGANSAYPWGLTTTDTGTYAPGRLTAPGHQPTGAA